MINLNNHKISHLTRLGYPRQKKWYQGKTRRVISVKLTIVIFTAGCLEYLYKLPVFNLSIIFFIRFVSLSCWDTLNLNCTLYPVKWEVDLVIRTSKHPSPLTNPAIQLFGISILSEFITGLLTELLFWNSDWQGYIW